VEETGVRLLNAYPYGVPWVRDSFIRCARCGLWKPREEEYDLNQLVRVTGHGILCRECEREEEA
jgi:hypothetical protein